MLRAIWAEGRGGVIGSDGGMPWHVPEDLRHFSRLTRGSAVIMGRRTWESFPERYRPLPERRNIVVTHDAGYEAPGGETAETLDDAIARAGNAWIIGGGQIYRQALGRIEELVVTEIDVDVAGDTVAPALGSEWSRSEVDPESGWHTSRTGTPFRFVTYTRGAGAR